MRCRLEMDESKSPRDRPLQVILHVGVSPTNSRSPRRDPPPIWHPPRPQMAVPAFRVPGLFFPRPPFSSFLSAPSQFHAPNAPQPPRPRARLQTSLLHPRRLSRPVDCRTYLPVLTRSRPSCGVEFIDGRTGLDLSGRAQTRPPSQSNNQAPRNSSQIPRVLCD